jgi:hypothetical protein
MAGAGFYTIHTSRLTFGRDGRWYADDEPVVHDRLARLFSRYLRRKPGGGYEIWIDERYHADVDIEDTPYVVISVSAEDEERFIIDLNDGSAELLDPGGLYTGADNVLYCRVKGGEERARFLRPAYYQLADWIEESESGGFRLRCGEHVYPIERA